MTRRTVVIASIAIVAFGCSDRNSESEYSEGSPSDSAADEPVSGTGVTILSCENLETEILGASHSREGFRRTHGSPDSILVWTEPNRHVEGAVDSLFTVYYPGLLASFRRPTGGRDLIVAAGVTSNRYLSDSTIGIGASEAEIVARLGEPTRREDSNLVYECGMEVEQPVTFEIRNGAVFAITVAYYVD